jgi:hypothetical protein
MIYLIGVNRCRAQRKKRGENTTDSQREFQSVIESVIQSIDPGLLAEEDHPDYLFEADADSVLLEIAKAHRIEDRHVFVDPSRAEREAIGYRSSKRIGDIHPPWPNGSKVARAHEIAHHFHKREEFWLAGLQDFLHTDILLACGWGHIESFSALLARKGVICSVWANRIGACPSDLRFDDAVRQYIKDNPAEFNNPSCPCLR